MRLGPEPLAGLTQLASGPPLYAVDDFLSPEDCEAVLALFGDEDWVSSNADHHGWDIAGFAAEIPAAADPMLSALADRMESFHGLPGTGPRTLRFRYYQPGEGHRLHGDAYVFEGLSLRVTTLLYLIDTEAGGETRFPAAEPEPVVVCPRQGRMVVWTSTRADGSPDPRSVHDAAEVIAGAKAVLLGFSYLPPAEHSLPLVIPRRHAGG